MEQGIFTALKRLGLSQHESQVLLAVLVMGQANAAPIGKRVNLPRQTAYSILKGLAEQGFVEQSAKGRSTTFSATLEHLERACDIRRMKLVESKAALQAEVPKILANQRGVELPRVRYYEGVSGLKRMFEDILLQYGEGKAPKLFRGYGVNKMQSALGDYLFEFVKERGKLGVETHLFIGEGEDDLGVEQEQLGRLVKRLRIAPQKAGMYLVGNRVYLFSFPDRVGVMIENAAIAQLLTVTFDDHWVKF
jgi:DNA-binding MarR family transcriptional regulator